MVFHQHRWFVHFDNPISLRLVLGLCCLLLSCAAPRRPPPQKDLVVVPAAPSTAPRNVVSSSENGLVKIGVRVEVQSVNVVCDGDIEVSLPGSGGGPIEKWKAGLYVISSHDGVLLVNNKPHHKFLTIKSMDDRFPLMIHDKPYRGVFLLRAHPHTKLTVINELSIDDYLKGVLPREVVVTWPLESLRVQAIASRTYLASHMNSHSGQGFNLCSDVHCQVYGGMGKEHPQTNEAVESTRRLILALAGKPIGAYFHSNCGGMTEKISHVWGRNDQLYLPRKRCDYGTQDPRYKWTYTIGNADILRLLKAKGLVKGSRIKTIQIQEKSPSGRARFVVVKTDHGSTVMKGNDFRIALHPEKVRSTKWSLLKPLGDGYHFAGTGWGHGVGMCQWGAKGQAEQGRNFRQILEFYYPGADLISWHRS